MQVSGFLGGLVAGVLLVRLWALLPALGNTQPCLDIFQGAVDCRSACKHAATRQARAAGHHCPTSAAAATAGPPRPVVYSVPQLYQDDYGRPGLAHITVAGARHHGMQRLEVWLQTFAPGVRTPVHRCDIHRRGAAAPAALLPWMSPAPAHRASAPTSNMQSPAPCRHDCEEVFVIQRGSGTALYRAPDGSMQAAAFQQNDTLTIPPNLIHQVCLVGRKAACCMLLSGLEHWGCP